MTLRARLLLSLGVLLAAALVITGALVVGVTQANLIEQVDGDLKSASLADVTEIGPPREDPDLTGRRFALLSVDSAGRVLQSLPSGFSRAPDPLPSLPSSGEPPLVFQVIVTRPSVDGTLSYRVLPLRGPQGRVVVLGAPLDDVEASMGALVGPCSRSACWH